MSAFIGCLWHNEGQPPQLLCTERGCPGKIEGGRVVCSRCNDRRQAEVAASLPDFRLCWRDRLKVLFTGKV